LRGGKSPKDTEEAIKELKCDILGRVSLAEGALQRRMQRLSEKKSWHHNLVVLNAKGTASYSEGKIRGERHKKNT